MKGRDGTPFRRGYIYIYIPAAVRVATDRICGVVEEAITASITTMTQLSEQSPLNTQSLVAVNMNPQKNLLLLGLRRHETPLTANTRLELGMVQ